MDNLFQVLIIDDNPTDIDLIKIQLKKIGVDLDFLTVSGKDEFEHFLKNHSLPDLVVCDYRFPHYEDKKAWEKVRERHSFLPFIIVTGYLNEEEVVQLMKEGASDIITKQRMERLGPAVRRELTNYRDRKKNLEGIEVVHKRFRKLLEQSSDVVIVLNNENFPEYLTPSVKQIFGYTVEEAKKLNIKQIIHPEDFINVEKILKKAKRSPGNKFLLPPVRMKQKNGSWNWYECSLTDLRHEPAVNGIVTNIRNIHEQVHNSRINKLMLNNTEDSFIYINRDFVIQNFNNRFAQNYRDIFGVKVKRGESILDYAQPERREIVKEIYNRVFKGESIENELSVESKEGGIRYFHSKYKPAKDEKGAIIGSFISLLETTREKKATLELEKNEARFRALVENGSDMLFILTPDGIPTYISPSIKNVLGYTAEEALQLDMMKNAHPDDVGMIRSEIQKCLERPGVPMKVPPARLKDKKGNWHWFEGTITNMLHDPAIEGIVDNFREITERIEAEKKIRDAEEKYRNVAEHSTNMFYQHDLEGKLNYVSPQSKDFLGYAPEEAIGKWTEFITDHPKNKTGIKTTQKAIETGEVQPPYMLQLRKANGEKIWVEVNEAPLKKEGNVVGIVGSLTDITDRLQYEEKLKESLERYDYVTKATYDAIWDWNLQENTIFWGEGFETLFGYKPEQEKAETSLWLNHIHPDDVDWVNNSVKKAVEGNAQNWFEEYRYIRENGTVAFVENRGFVIRADNGEATRMIGAMRDVTEQRELKELLNNAQKMAKIGAWEINLKTDEVYWSPVTREIHEAESDFTPDLNTAINFYKEGENREAIESAAKKAIEEGIPWDLELQIVTARGNEKWIRAKGAADMENGRCTRLYGSFQDIHDRKDAQIKMVNALKERQRILERITEAFFAIDQNWKITYWNSQAEELGGISRDDILEKNFWEVFPDAKELKFFREYNRAFDEQVAVHFEEYYQPMDIWLEVNAYPSQDGLSVFVRDMTERKAAEDEIKSANEKLKTAQKIARLGYWERNICTEDIYWSDEVYRIWGMEPDEIKPNVGFFKSTIHPDDLEKFSNSTERALKGDSDHDLEHRIILKDGVVKWVHERGALVRDKKGNPLTFKGTVQDITVKKNSELAVETAYREKETILESIGDGFFTLDKKWHVTYWNSAAEIFLETPKESILNKNLWEVFDDAVNLPSYRYYHKVMNEGVAVEFEDYYEPLHKWFDVSAYPSTDGISVFFKDISERKLNEEKIRRINERFEKVTEATNDAIWDYNVHDDELFWGKGFETLFGYNLDETEPTLDYLINLIHSEDRERIVKKIERYMQADSETNWFEEYRFQKNDGTYAYVMDRAVFIRDGDGIVIRVVGAMTDLTNQKEYEESLKKLNEELEVQAKELAASNAELEQFAYVASHDLQEPLRMVSSFLTQLDKKYSDKLDEKAQKYIHFAVDGAQRMRQIILDLLNYSRLNRDHQKREKVNLNRVLEEVQSLIRSRIDETGAKISIQKLPTVEANSGAIKQVFQNLLNNALKYHRPGVTPVISIKAEDIGTHWKFRIKDNGIGIDPAFQDTIFQIFQRLHTREQYSGTGIGLAISKKIVERHNGEIWVESAEGKGSTFYFTISR